MKFFFCLIIISSCFIYSCGENPNENLNWKPQDGYVPDEDTAIKMAEIVGLRVYGKQILNQRPFVASLSERNVWIVRGTYAEAFGGVMQIEIQKNDGKILKLTHGK